MRDLAPQEARPGLLEKLRTFAEEHSLVINDDVLHKVTWMEEHGWRCFCDWSSGRICPCIGAMSDLATYNGACLCSVLHTDARHHRHMLQKKRIARKRTPEEKAELKKREKEAKAKAAKLFKKG